MDLLGVSMGVADVVAGVKLYVLMDM